LGVDLVAGNCAQTRFDGGHEFAYLPPVILAGTVATFRPSDEALHDRHNWSGKEDNLIDQVKEASHVLGTTADEKRHGSWAKEQSANAILLPDPVFAQRAR
jgi:hypothetical protein